MDYIIDIGIIVCLLLTVFGIAVITRKAVKSIITYKKEKELAALWVELNTSDQKADKTSLDEHVIGTYRTLGDSPKTHTTKEVIELVNKAFLVYKSDDSGYPGLQKSREIEEQKWLHENILNKL